MASGGIAGARGGMMIGGSEKSSSGSGSAQ